jgi:hypothetical protein
MLIPNNKSNQTASPSANIEDQEFNDISLKFGSLLSMIHNKCLNHVAVLSIIMKNPTYKKIYLSLLDSDNIYGAIQTFIQNTPNLYKKIAKKSLFK